MDTLARFVADLSNASIGSTTNPYSCHDPAHDREGGAAIRAANVLAYLRRRKHPALMLVGEAAGYRGCRFSGIAFTSERTLPADQRTSLDPRGWNEPSATIVHGALHDLGLEERTLLWNAVPTHPAGAGPLTNRTPTRVELAEGHVWLQRLIALVRPDAVVAIGLSALHSLGDVPVLRHPANGGASKFRAGIAQLAADLGERL